MAYLQALAMATRTPMPVLSSRTNSSQACSDGVVSQFSLRHSRISSVPQKRFNVFSRQANQLKKAFTVVCQAKSDSETQDVGAAGIAAISGGLVSVPVVAWSLYTLKTTGCGLPPGPGGSIGALEGVSYLVIFGVIAWSAYTKVKTGSGLPSGPFGLLGAVEGLSYLTVLAILAVFGLQYLDYGFIPGPVPGEQCFG